MTSWHRRIHKRIKLRRERSRTSSGGSSSNSILSADSYSAMDHSHSEEQLWGAVEILPQRLYYAPLKFFPAGTAPGDEGASSSDHDDEQQQPGQKRRKPIHYFSIDHELLYWNFFLDFGPLNLGQLYRFCAKLNAKLSSPEYKDHIICYYSGAKGEARANASFLVCAWSMLYLGRSLEESYFGFREEWGLPAGSRGDDGEAMPPSNNVSLPPQLRLRRSSSNVSSSSKGSEGSGDDHQSTGPSPFATLHPLPPFHDASPIVCTYDLSVHDCLQGLDKARKLGFFKFDNAPDAVVRKPSADEPETTWPPRTPTTFNVEEYEHFEQVENGDLNWIVADRILAFAGPQAARTVTPEGFCMLTPADYIPYFERRNVKLVVRLNKKCYEEKDFERVGMKHVEHYYLDGSCPPLSILHDVVADMESIGDSGAMAVHCKAGLGRTGTCIGAYLMKHYRLTAREVIGWMRICRPGMVIGPQQHFVEDIEGLMWQEGDVYRGSGLRSMSMGSEEDEAEEGGRALEGAQTPPAKGGVSIVTPAGEPLHLPTTPVVSRGPPRKLDVGEAMVISPPPASPASAAAAGMRSTPSSASSLPAMGALNVTPAKTEDVPMKEGDQANALLSRRIEQSRTRHRREEEQSG
ncbi:hypothetical protein ACHAXT_010882 [Thalassiosira profunda]